MAASWVVISSARSWKLAPGLVEKSPLEGPKPARQNMRATMGAVRTGGGAGAGGGLAGGLVDAAGVMGVAALVAGGSAAVRTVSALDLRERWWALSARTE